MNERILLARLLRRLSRFFFHLGDALAISCELISDVLAGWSGDLIAAEVRETQESLDEQGR